VNIIEEKSSFCKIVFLKIQWSSKSDISWSRLFILGFVLLISVEGLFFYNNNQLKAEIDQEIRNIAVEF